MNQTQVIGFATQFGGREGKVKLPRRPRMGESSHVVYPQVLLQMYQFKISVHFPRERGWVGQRGWSISRLKTESDEQVSSPQEQS